MGARAAAAEDAPGNARGEDHQVPHHEQGQRDAHHAQPDVGEGGEGVRERAFAAGAAQGEAGEERPVEGDEDPPRDGATPAAEGPRHAPAHGEIAGGDDEAGDDSEEDHRRGEPRGAAGKA